MIVSFVERVLPMKESKVVSWGSRVVKGRRVGSVKSVAHHGVEVKWDLISGDGSLKVKLKDMLLSCLHVGSIAVLLKPKVCIPVTSSTASVRHDGGSWILDLQGIISIRYLALRLNSGSSALDEVIKSFNITSISSDQR